jgi:hypothetical protein
MSRFIKLAWPLLAAILLGLASCGGGTPTTDPSLAYTQIWQTVALAQTQTALAVTPTPRVTETTAVSPTSYPTNTPLLTSTPLPGVPSATPLTIATMAVTQSSTCDNYQFVTDVTYADGSEVAAGQPFVKTWRVKNLGPCTWSPTYRLIFGWGGIGTNWNTNAAIPFGVTVVPGDTFEISITLKAPTTAGNYAAAFRLQNSNGYNFGNSLTVVVVVK